MPAVAVGLVVGIFVAWLLSRRKKQDAGPPTPQPIDIGQFLQSSNPPLNPVSGGGGDLGGAGGFAATGTPSGNNLLGPAPMTASGNAAGVLGALGAYSPSSGGGSTVAQFSYPQGTRLRVTVLTKTPMPADWHDPATKLYGIYGDSWKVALVTNQPTHLEYLATAKKNLLQGVSPTWPGSGAIILGA